jgi:molybdopterin molybdotransferase
MDGYAVRAVDGVLGARLAMIGAAPAGHPFAGALGPGQAVRIFTGGFVPAGADSILLQEDAEAADGAVLVKEGVTAGRWVRKRGLDFAEGETLLAQGRRLTARDIGARASAFWRRGMKSPCPETPSPRAASSVPMPMLWPL